MVPHTTTAGRPIENRSLLLLRISNILFLLLTLAVNYLANALPLGGNTTGQLSARYPNLFTPAPLTFSIWIVIYLALIAFAVWQVTPLSGVVRSQNRDEAVLALGWKFAGLCLLNVGWLFCWHYELVLASVLVMLVMLWLLIGINRLVFTRLAHTPDNRNFLQIPFGLNLGWISVATVANITVLLVAVRWDGLGLSDQFWTLVMMAIATLIALWAARAWNNVPYALAVAWALAGIAIKHQQLFGDPISPVILAAYTGILVLLLAAGSRLGRWWNGAVHGPEPTVYRVSP